MQYNPDSWLIIKVNGDEPHYRIFGCWTGGYMYGDEWRLNSGVKSVTQDGDFYCFVGDSGSVYRCHRDTYCRVSLYCTGTLAKLVEGSQGTIEVIEKMPDNIIEFDWII